jgi:hypothetical protein
VAEVLAVVALVAALLMPAGDRAPRSMTFNPYADLNLAYVTYLEG